MTTIYFFKSSKILRYAYIENYIFSISSLSSSCLPLVLLLVLTCCFLFCLRELLRLVLYLRFILFRLLPCSRLKFLRWWRTVVRVLDLGPFLAFDIDLRELLAINTPGFCDIFLAMLKIILNNEIRVESSVD